MNSDGSNDVPIWYYMLTDAEVIKFKLPKTPTGARGISEYVGARIGDAAWKASKLGFNRDAVYLKSSDGTWMSIKDKSAESLVETIRKTHSKGRDVSLMLAQAQEKESNKDVTGALELFKKATDLDPQIPNADYVEGYLEFLVGEYGRALTKLRMAAEKFPKDRSVLLSLAECYYALHEFDQASATIEEYLSSGLDLSKDILSRKVLYDLFAGKVGLALEEARELVRIEPTDSETAAAYAAACAASQSNEDAVAQLKLAIKFSPDKMTKFFVNVAKGFIMTNDYASAARIVKESLSFDPSNNELIELSNQIGDNKSIEGNGVKSLMDSYKTLGLQPGVGKEIVEAVYQTLVKQYHPDANTGATPAVKKIAEAYREVISHLS